ncbi:MAG: MBL fold metallo-hydrolase [Deltaproteobacteria bacterium]|nr:MBL fold metallo-hydrolase [Deltaproteobacteria bacterium]
MLGRRELLGGIAAVAGCGLKLPPPPARTTWSWEPDRAALPDVSIRALHVATIEMAEKHVVSGGKGKDGQRAPVTVYVLEHPTEGLVLIDAGYGRRTLADPLDYPGKLVNRLLELEMKTTLADRLGDIGRDIGDVRHAVLTHLHHDHSGGVEDLPPETTVWISEREAYAGDRRRPLGGYDPSPYTTRKFRYFPFVGAGAYGPFAHHADLFGDGSVIVLDAPGHTMGEVCVLVNRPTKSYLFTGDAAWVDRNWQEPIPVGALPARLVVWDWRRSYEQLWRIHEWAETHPELTVIAGHEPANLTRLPEWPAPFA